MVTIALLGCVGGAAIPSAGVGARVDNDDGTWSYALEADFDPSELAIRGPITWEYDGQALFTDERTGPLSHTFVYPGDPPPISGLDRLFRMVRIDRDGHRWRVADVDTDAWAALVQRENEEAVAAGEEVPAEAWEHPATRIYEERSGFEAGEEITETIATWTNGCTSGTTVFDRVWNSENRVLVGSGALLDRQKSTVLVSVSGVGSCSGVLLDSTHVLTAAHCFVTSCNNNGPEVFAAPSAVRVCTWGNNANYADGGDVAECVTGASPASQIEDFHVAPNLDFGCDSTTGLPEGDRGDDWALINIDEGSPFAYATDMDTSTLSDTGQKAIHSLGYPSQIPGTCSNNTATAQVFGFATGQLFKQNGVDFTEFNGAMARATMDAMSRQSGSPVYYCAGSDDNCDDGEKGVVAMVLAAFDQGANDRWVGPRVAHHRSDIIAVMH